MNSSGHFPRIYDMIILQEIQKDLEEKNIQPENFKDRIIFEGGKSDDQNRISHAEKTQELREELLTRTLDFSGSGVGKRDGYGDSHGGHWDRTTKWYSNSKKLVILSS